MIPPSASCITLLPLLSRPLSFFAIHLTAESFLSSLSKKSAPVDISKYEPGQRVYHKKFGEGTISKIEPEGDDLKVEIAFDKSGNKRLMAKYAGLEIL